MNPRPFVGRRRELEALQRELAAPRPSFVVVMGRRRVGKSRLLLEATEGRPTVYFQATRVVASLNIALFKRSAAQFVDADPVWEGLQDWAGVLAYLQQEGIQRSPGLTVVLDEFPYLCEDEASLPSVIQLLVDRPHTSPGGLNLVLCGSKLSFMSELLGERNPLHGRHTLLLDLAPLNYRETADFFPGWSPQERLRAYGVFGGIPHYLVLTRPELTLAENAVNLALTTGAPLADEPTHLLQSELRDVARYATILQAVADGCTDTGSILGRVRELKDSSALAPYIRKLEELRLVRVVRSLNASPKERQRKYFLADPFLAFWYRFCLPNLSPLAAGHGQAVWGRSIYPHLDGHMGGIFEWICRDALRLFGPEWLSTPMREVGTIWGPDFDLDVAGTLLDGRSVWGECKWRSRPIGVSALDELRARAAAVGPLGKKAGMPSEFLIFSRSGFTSALTARAQADPHLQLLSLAHLLGPK